MTTRDELVVALAGRYALGSREERGRMLDEFAALRATIASTRCACSLLGYRAAVLVRPRSVGCMIKRRVRR